MQKFKKNWYYIVNIKCITIAAFDGQKRSICQVDILKCQQGRQLNATKIDYSIRRNAESFRWER